MATIVIDLRSDSSEVEDSLNTVTRGLRGVSSGLKQVDSAAQKQDKSLKKAAKGADGMKDTLGGLKAAAEGVGGSLGGAAGQIEKFAQAGGLLGPLAIALGVVALAATGIGIAVFKAGSAFISMTRDAGETIETLKDFNGVLRVSDESLNSIESANASLDALSVVWKALKAEIVSLGLGDIFSDMTKLLLIFGLVSIDVFEKFGNVIVTTFEDAINNALIPFRGRLKDLAEAYIELSEALGVDLPGLDKVKNFLKEIGDVSVFKAVRSGLTGMISLSGEYAEQAEEILGIQLALNKAGKEGTEQHTEAIVEQLSWVDLLNQKLDRQKEVVEGTFASESEIHEKRLSNARAIIGATNAFARNALATSEQIANKFIKDEEKRAKVIKGIRIASWLANKAAALSEIAINTAVSLSKAAAQTGVGVAFAAGPLVALGALQASAVIAAPIPQFPHGGIVPQSVLAADHGLVSAQPGEGVVSKRGMRDLGSNGLDALNNGSSAGNMLVVQNVYKHRVFDSFVQDNIRKGGPLSDAISTRKVGQTVRNA